MRFFAMFKKPKEKQASVDPNETKKHLGIEEPINIEQPRSDWRKSKAHLLLLSKFVNARPSVDFIKYGDWENVLGEPPQQAIQRFVRDGAIVDTDVSGLLAYRFKVSDLIEMLKQRGLSIKGPKNEMVQRLVCADPPIPLDKETQNYIARRTEGFTPAQIQEVIYSLVIERPESFNAMDPTHLFREKAVVDRLICRISGTPKTPLGFQTQT